MFSSHDFLFAYSSDTSPIEVTKLSKLPTKLMLLVHSFQLVPKTHPEQTGFLYMQSETEKSLSIESIFLIFVLCF